MVVAAVVVADVPRAESPAAFQAMMAKISIAIGIVHNKLRPLASFAQVSNIGTELKKGAKTSDKSAYILDKRKD